MDRDRILERLRAPHSSYPRGAAELVVRSLLQRTVAEVVDGGAWARLITTALSADNTAWLLERHLVPAWRRHHARCSRGQERVADTLPEETRDALLQHASTVSTPRAAWARGAVDPALLRQLLAPVFQKTLLMFARKLPMVGRSNRDESPREGRGGLAGRLRKGVEKRAEKLAGVGKSVMGGLGVEVDRRIQNAAKEFSQSAMSELRESLAERLRSEEGKALTDQIRAQALSAVLQAEVTELMDDAERLGLGELRDSYPSIVAHGVARGFTEQIVQEEVDALLHVEGEHTLESILVRTGLLSDVTTMLEARAEDLARHIFASDEFEGWLDSLLEE